MSPTPSPNPSTSTHSIPRPNLLRHRHRNPPRPGRARNPIVGAQLRSLPPRGLFFANHRLPIRIKDIRALGSEALQVGCHVGSGEVGS